MAIGRAMYRSGEFALEYSHESRSQPTQVSALDRSLGIRKPPDWLVNAGTLILGFSREDLALHSFDAYTNRQRWQTARGALVPTPSREGRLLLRDRPSDERLAMPVEPEYLYSEEAGHLCIRLISNQPAVSIYYQISDHLVVEVAAGVLGGLYILNFELQ